MIVFEIFIYFQGRTVISGRVVFFKVFGMENSNEVVIPSEFASENSIPSEFIGKIPVFQVCVCPILVGNPFFLLGTSAV